MYPSLGQATMVNATININRIRKAPTHELVLGKFRR